MALLQLLHQETVRQHDEVHMPGLALGVTQLTVSHAQLLLAIPVEGLRAGPTMAVHPQNTTNFPGCPIADQYFGRFGIVLVLPENDNTHLMVHVGNVHTGCEVPLTALADLNQFAAVPDQLAIELQVADVGTRLPVGQAFAVNMVENFGVGEVVVESEVAGDVLGADPIDQFDTQMSMVDEGLLLSGAELLRAETAEMQGVVLAAGANVVGEQVVLGNLVALLGVVPKVAGIRDKVALVINQDVIARD